jgi:hypothetical protein
MPNSSTFMSLEGSCRCGQVRFRMESAPIITHACHCRLCQQTSGSAFQIFAMIETDRLVLVYGRTEGVQYAKSQKRVQCSDCGCALWIHRPDLGNPIAFVGVGTLDQNHPLVPEAHYFVRSKFTWIELPSGVPAFQELGNPGKKGVGERIGAALAGAKRCDPKDTELTSDMSPL